MEEEKEHGKYDKDSDINKKINNNNIFAPYKKINSNNNNNNDGRNTIIVVHCFPCTVWVHPGEDSQPLHRNSS